MGNIIDITARKRVEDALAYRLSIEQMIGSISTSFLNLQADKIENEISRSLELISSFLGADKSYIYEFTSDGDFLQMTYEWFSPGIKKDKKLKKIKPASSFPWIVKTTRHFEIAYVQNLEELPPEAGEERKMWEKEGIKSLVSVPMSWSGSLAGFLVLDSRHHKKKWAEEDIVLLRTVTDIFVNALVRKKVEEDIRKLNEELEERVATRTSELQIANDALIESEAKYRRLIENLPESYFFFAHNTSGIYTYVSPSIKSVLGYSEKQFLCHYTRHLTDNPVNEQAIEKTNLCIQGIKQPAYELEIFHKDQTKRIFEILEVPVINDNNYVIAVEGIAHDITEHKRNLEMIRKTQEQLIQSEKMAALGNLVAGVAHEINTPVGIGVTAASHLDERTKTFVELYAQGKLRRSELEAYLSIAEKTTQMILSNLNRASNLILSFKQVAVDQSSEEQRLFELKEYINEVFQSLHPELNKTKHKIVINCPDDIEMNSFPGAFSQILTNLVMNSIIHGFENIISGTITISITLKGGNVRILYHDNGSGILPENIKKVFEPFFTTRRGSAGSGLGMHIVYNLVTQTLQGTIECSSRKNEGTTFKINVPVNTEIINES